LTTALPPTSVPSTQQTNCNEAQFISDLNVPDGTIITPGQTFTKSWRIKNIGTCTWTTDYLIIFLSGDRMTGAGNQALPSNVKPGENVDLSVNLVAPDAEGNYIGGYALQDANGEKFISFTVNINVQAAATPEPEWVTIFTAQSIDVLPDIDSKGYVSNYEDLKVATANGSFRLTFDYDWIGDYDKRCNDGLNIQDYVGDNPKDLNISISRHGEYSVYIWDHSNFVIRPTESSAIDKTGGTMQIEARDNLVTILINEETIASFEFEINDLPHALYVDGTSGGYKGCERIWFASANVSDVVVEELR
jgi:hypothetical protein